MINQYEHLESVKTYTNGIFFNVIRVISKYSSIYYKRTYPDQSFVNKLVSKIK